MNLISEDYLMHHGVKGMKWGVRKDPRVVNAADKRNRANRVYAKAQDRAALYNLRHPSSMFYGSKNYNSLKKLTDDTEKARKAVDKANRDYYDTKRLVKNEKYKEKLTNKAKKNASSARANARESTKEYNDLKNNGMKSEAWRNRSNEKAKQYVEKNGSFWGTIDAIAYSQSKGEHAAYTERVRVDAQEWNSIGRNWSKKQKNLMNMQITKTTTKKDIKNVYKGK